MTMLQFQLQFQLQPQTQTQTRPRPPAPPVHSGRRPADVPSSMIARVTRILAVFDGPHDHLPLAEVSRRTGLPNSTTHRILDTLVRYGWVEQFTSTYRLGRRTRRFGADGGHLRLRSVAHPFLHALHVATGMKVCLCVLDGGDAVCVDRIGGGGLADTGHKVGERRSALRCAAGRAMLADPGTSDADEALDSLRAGGGADGTWTADGLREEFALVRRSGFSVGRSAEPQEADCVAAAIPLPGGRCSAVCIHSVFPQEKRTAHVRGLTRTAHLITAEMTSAGPGAAGVPA